MFKKSCVYGERIQTHTREQRKRCNARYELNRFLRYLVLCCRYLSVASPIRTVCHHRVPGRLSVDGNSSRRVIFLAFWTPAPPKRLSTANQENPYAAGMSASMPGDRGMVFCVSRLAACRLVTTRWAIGFLDAFVRMHLSILRFAIHPRSRWESWPTLYHPVSSELVVV